MKNMLKKEYLISDGRIYEVVGHDGMGFPVCALTDLKEIPEDKPLEKPVKEEKPEKPVKEKKAAKK